MTAIVLASTSRARATILAAAGVAFETAAPEVDESLVEAEILRQGAAPREIAERLAELKAMEVSRRRSELVIGADQTLELAGVLIDKPESLPQARERLIALRGRRHSLHSAVAVAIDGEVRWRATDTTSLAMRRFSDAFLDDYLRRTGEAVLACAGCYQIEGEGLQLFEAIEGDHFSILGLPLIALLGFLRRQGALAQ